MNIRKATLNDLDDILSIFKKAREYMANNGNYSQWNNSRPKIESIIKDINNNTCNVIVDDNDNIVATFSFIIGVDPTYLVIKNGKWLNDNEYGTIHRIASNQEVHGIFDIVLKYCKSFNVDIRIDTHENNMIMLYLLKKYNFKQCGIITIDDNTDRIAFQLER